MGIIDDWERDQQPGALWQPKGGEHFADDDDVEALAALADDEANASYDTDQSTRRLLAGAAIHSAISERAGGDFSKFGDATKELMDEAGGSQAFVQHYINMFGVNTGNSS